MRHTTDWQRRITIRIQGQGNLVKAQVQSNPVKGKGQRPRGPRHGGGIRKPTKEFTRRSRMRLLDLLQRLVWAHLNVVFLSLTYHNEWPDPMTAKKHLREFRRRLLRIYGTDSPWIWRLEFHVQRGAPHFHILVFNLPFVPKETILQLWRQVTGDATIDRTRIEIVRNPWKVKNYIAKLTDEGQSGLVVVTYSHTASDAVSYMGRFWGVMGRAFLPFAELVEEVVTCTAEAFYTFKRAARRYWRGVNRKGDAGFTLFVKNPQRWLALWHYCLRDAPA